MFLDQTDLGSGRSWVTQLQAGIDRSEHFILVATPEALASPRVGDEWGSFLSTRRGWLEQGRLHLVSLVDVPMPPFLSQVQRVDFRNAGEAKYRQALRELVAGLLGHSDRRNLPALPAELVIPPPPDPGLDPRLRARLVEWLTPVLASKAYRKAIAPELQLKSAELEGQPSWECAASALLVWATGDEEPLAAAIRIVDTLGETLGEDEPARVAELAPPREELLRLRQDAPERGLLATWMDQVVKDHEPISQSRAGSGGGWGAAVFPPFAAGGGSVPLDRHAEGWPRAALARDPRGGCLDREPGGRGARRRETAASGGTVSARRKPTPGASTTYTATSGSGR